jgi:hypothetical protein
MSAKAKSDLIGLGMALLAVGIVLAPMIWM